PAQPALVLGGRSPNGFNAALTAYACTASRESRGRGAHTIPAMKRRTFLGAALAAPLAARVPAAATGRGAALVANGLDVAVIGAGAFGGWTAIELVRRGARVTLV